MWALGWRAAISVPVSRLQGGFLLGLLLELGRLGARKSVSSVWERPCPSCPLCSLWPLDGEASSLVRDPTGQASAVTNRSQWPWMGQPGRVCAAGQTEPPIHLPHRHSSRASPTGMWPWPWPVEMASGGMVNNGSPIFLGLKGSCESSCADPLFFAGKETEIWSSEIACPRSPGKPRFKVSLHHRLVTWP